MSTNAKPPRYKIEVTGSLQAPIECDSMSYVLDHVMRLIVDEGVAWKHINIYKLTNFSGEIILRIGDTTASGGWSKP